MIVCCRVIRADIDTKDIFCAVDFPLSSDGLSRRPVSKQVSVLSCHSSVADTVAN